MVTFRLVEENEKYIIYWYFPEGNEKKEHGEITIDKQINEINTTKLAADDFYRTITVEEQNKVRDSINQMRIEAGRKELTEKELPVATEEYKTTFYSDHAISKIVQSYKEGIILKNGTAAWY